MAQVYCDHGTSAGEQGVMTADRKDSALLLEAMLKCDGQTFRSHEVRDISMEGVFVLARDGTLSRLRRNSPVELALKMHANGKTSVHVLQAEIKQVTHDGAMLVFKDADISAYGALLHLSLQQEH